MAKSICYSLLFTTMATVNLLLSPLSPLDEEGGGVPIYFKYV